MFFAGPLKPTQLYNYQVKILGVIDGDTIDVEFDLGFKISFRDRVRLLGIDTKEIFGPKAEPAGQTSKLFTCDWLNEGNVIKLSVRKYDDREKYGRILAVFYRDDDPVSLNDALINAKLARPSPKTWGEPEG